MGSYRNAWFRWHLHLSLLCLITMTTARPQDPKQISSTTATILSDNRIIQPNVEINKDLNKKSDAKSNTTAIRESIKMVASQLLQSDSNPPPTSRDGGIVIDIRTPPKLKTQQVNKNKVKANPTTLKPQSLESSHAGIAMPMTAEELENEITTKRNQSSITASKESSTSDEGISTWILLSGSPATTTVSPKSQMKKIDSNEVDKQKSEEKPAQFKPKPKTTPKSTRQPTPTMAPKPVFTRRPIAIGSSNKADLIASGSAVNENVMNKIKASVLASVQKNKNAALNKTTPTAIKATTASTTTTTTTTQRPIKNEVVVTFDPKPISTSNDIETVTHNMRRDHEIIKKIESKASAENIIIPDTLNMGIEAKEAEIELEVSTPPMPTSKKPKRTSTKRKKNKNRRRKPLVTTTPKAESPELKTAKAPTKAVSKVPPKDKPITTQIYNYLSREVMPSVGVGLVSLAGLVGLASYFLYPFSGVVRRAYDANDRKDDLYYQNGESYATDDAGQSEEEMLGKVLAGMPADAIGEQNINPYMGQTQFRYPQPKPPQEQNLRYRNVPYNSELNSYVSSDRVGQQSADTVHASTYSEQIHYDTHERNDNFSPYHQPQPVYKAVEKVVESNYPIEPTHTSYADEISSSKYPDKVYPEKISGSIYPDKVSASMYSDKLTGSSYSEKISAPTYVQAINNRYNHEMIGESTESPVVETLHLGADDIIEKQKETGYTVGSVGIDDSKQPQFVVGNVPKELIQAVTPITVPEHGPRSMRFRRSAITDNLEQVLKEARENTTDPELSNEIDEALGLPVKYHKKKMPEATTNKNVEPTSTTTSKPIISSTFSNNIVSISEIGSYLSTRKYGADDVAIESKAKSEEGAETEVEFLPNINEIIKSNELNATVPEKIFIELTTQDEASPEEATESVKDETTTDAENYPDTEPAYYPKKHTFFSFLKSLFEFKLRLGMSLLQTTTESIARYLRGVETHLRSASHASEQAQSTYYYKH